jgi:hypothetical protein
MKMESELTSERERAAFTLAARKQYC